MKRIVFCLAGFLSFATVSMAQSVLRSVPHNETRDFTMPVPSPKVKVTQQFSTSNIELEYSRPSMKGRKIFGEMIPFERPWRTGANAISTITFGEEVSFGGQPVKPGTYALYTIPNKESWIVLLNSNYKSSGLNDIKPEYDVAKVKVTPITTGEAYETFTIELNNISDTKATLNIIWENTKVPVEIVADNKERILKYLEKELQGKNPPYREASYYYYEINYKLEEALKYADKVLEQNPKAFWIHSHKAKIYDKIGKKDDALHSAKKAAELTRGTQYEQEYRQKLNEYK